MNVSEAIENITFWAGTVADITGNAVNTLFKNKPIVTQLQFALDAYAKETKAIEDIYSISIDTHTAFINKPPLALRSESYKAMMYVSNGYVFPCDMQMFANVYSNFPVKGIQGITNWLLPWGTGSNDFIYVYPQAGASFNTTTVSSNITATDTTIPATSTAGFLVNDGKITIGNEKIYYQYKDLTNFYGCTRGVQQTTASAHTSSTAINEHNIWLMYSRLHTRLYTADNIIPQAILDTELEVPDEHLETILKYATYNLVVKVDPDRANAYKVDWVAFLDKARGDVKLGRSRIHAGRQIRNLKPWENSQAYWPSVIY
jgi:hypothetical protein